MRIIRVLGLEGPNVWSTGRVLEVQVDQESLDAGLLQQGLHRLGERLAKIIPRIRPTPIIAVPWRAESGDELGTLMALTLDLQRRVNVPVHEGFVLRGGGETDAGGFVVEITEEVVGRQALDLAWDLWQAALRNAPFDLDARLARLGELAEKQRLDSATESIVQAARARGIATLRLDEGSLVQLGYGVNQRRIQMTVTDRSGHIAESLSCDKELTKRLLKLLGVPVPEGRVVFDAEEAWVTAQEVGLPVVVKPRDADYGFGVSLRLQTRAEVLAGYAEAREYSDGVIVERFLEGVHHRVTVVGGRVVGAVRREPLAVVGDGQRTVRELIEELNRDPRRGPPGDPQREWRLVPMDDDLVRVLARQGRDVNSVVRCGEAVEVRTYPSLCWGGPVVDVTDHVHPEVAATVIDAVSMIGLDVAGVDVIAADLSRPLAEQNAGVLEVNAEPAIYLHQSPYCEPSRPVAEAIISLMFDRPEDARIPLVAVCGDDHGSRTTRHIVDLLGAVHPVVGRASSDGVFLGSRCLRREPSDNLAGSRMLLMYPRLEAAVCEVSLASVRHEGLTFPRSDVALLLTTDGRDAKGWLSEEDRVAAMQVFLDTAASQGAGILNIDEPELARFALHSRFAGIVISTDATQPVVQSLIRRGSRAVFLRDGYVVLATSSRETVLFSLDDVSLRNSAAIDSTRALLATVAAGWALHFSLQSLRLALTQALPQVPVSAA